MIFADHADISVNSQPILVIFYNNFFSGSASATMKIKIKNIIQFKS